MSVLALIPARAGSKGIPGKNLRTLGGTSLILHAVKCAWEIQTPTLDVAVSTDIEAYWSANDASYTAIKRPPELAQDDTPMVAVVEHALSLKQFDWVEIVLLLQPTQPFRTPAHLNNALTLLRESKADSVVSVVELPQTHRPDFALGIHDGELYVMDDRIATLGQIPTRRQDTLPAYIRDGTVYAFWRKTVRKHDLYGTTVVPLIIPAHETCELDTEADWAAVETRWTARG